VPGFLAAGAAVLGGAALATVTAIGVVTTVNGGTSAQPEQQVVDYGTTATE
jgi:hypothetical protein